MHNNYDTKLSGEIITANYELVYYVAENVGIIGILPYPKIPFNNFFKDNAFLLILLRFYFYYIHKRQKEGMAEYIL